MAVVLATLLVATGCDVGVVCSDGDSVGCRVGYDNGILGMPAVGPKPGLIADSVEVCNLTATRSEDSGTVEESFTSL